MPQQESRRKVDSAAVQGKGSFVVFKPITWGEADELEEEISKHANDSAWQKERTRQLYADHLLDWNWSDADANPFELPSKDPDVFKRLTLEEVAFIDKLFEVKRDPKP